MKKGSYTVEAALLMGILLPLLTGILSTGVFLQSRAKVYGEALEWACTSVLTEEAKENVTIGTKYIEASSSKKIPVFPMAGQFFHWPGEVEAVCTVERQNPSRTIFRIHSLKRVIRQVIE